MNAGQIMDTAIVTLRRDAALSEIYAVMNQYRQTDFPVIDTNSQVVGMLYEEDLLKALSGSFRAVDGSAADFLESAGRAVNALNVRAEEIMTPSIGWVSTETELGKLVFVMREKKVRCLPVFGNGQVLGIVTERAIFMALLKQSLQMKAASSASAAAVKPAALPQERRRHPRKPASFKLAYKPVSFKLSYRSTDVLGNPVSPQARIARCLNLSLGGMLVSVSENFNPDDVLDIAFEIPVSHLPVRRLARVARSAPGVEQGTYQLGLFFLALSVQETNALSAYLKTLPD